MDTKNNNIIKHDWGYELIWAKEENYVAKMLVFENINAKNPFKLYQKKTRTWFVNHGNFSIKWIDTTNGEIFQQIINEGQVFVAKNNTPYSIQSTIKDSSLTEVADYPDDKEMIMLSTKYF